VQPTPVVSGRASTSFEQQACPCAASRPTIVEFSRGRRLLIPTGFHQHGKLLPGHGLASSLVPVTTTTAESGLDPAPSPSDLRAVVIAKHSMSRVSDCPRRTARCCLRRPGASLLARLLLLYSTSVTIRWRRRSSPGRLGSCAASGSPGRALIQMSIGSHVYPARYVGLAFVSNVLGIDT